MAKNKIHALEFKCSAGLKFIEHCKSCAKQDKCADRGRTKAIINGKKILVYDLEDSDCFDRVLKYFDPGTN
ncbi:MAG: hypothetical protein ACW980_23860 [Promethearchaeota archaeon]|jgi:hypothetical protein